MIRRGFLGAFAAMAFSLGAAMAHAQADEAASYPSRSIKVVVPFPAGGTADALTRIVAEKLREKWGQPIITDNRAGAGGNIGAEYLAKSDPDGYSLLSSSPGPIAINEILYKNLKFKPSELSPITLLGTSPNVVDVRSDFPAKSIAELVTYARANPEKVTFASQGNGTTSHLTAMLFQKLTETRMTHVPYRGTAPALQDVAGGAVDIFFDNLGSSLSLHKDGRLRIVGVCGPERAPQLPDIPTVSESGVPGFQSVTWFAFAAPKGTPTEIIAKINQAVTEVLRDPDVKSKFAALGVEARPLDVKSTIAFIEAERGRWGDIIKSTNIAVD